MGSINHPIVGRVAFTPLSGGRIALGDWPATHIKTALVPQLAGVPTYGGTRFSGKVPFYGPAIPQLVAAFAAVEASGLKHRVIFWGGSFVPRMKRGSRTSPSEHTFGCAFDINPAENPFRREAAQKDEKGYLLDLCPIFEAFGFECGAKWRIENRDAMHFQIKRLMSAPEIAAASRLYATKAPVKTVPVPPVRENAKPAPIYTLNGAVLQGARIENERLLAPVRVVTDALGYTLQAGENGALKAWREELEAV